MVFNPNNNSELIYEVNERGERTVVRSLESNHRVYLRFKNCTSRPVDVWWRDFNGKKRHYIRLPVGIHYNLNSFLTHPWEFTDAATKERFAINNKPIFYAPNPIGDMGYRTNWNITVMVRPLRRLSMLAVATLLPSREAASELGLPMTLSREVAELAYILRNPTCEVSPVFEAG